MSLSMHALAVPTFLNTLGALSKILDKAAAHCEAKKIDPATLLSMRLYPDMFTFTKQVQLACDFAKNTMGRLTGEPPKFPDEEKSFAELKARIAKTVAKKLTAPRIPEVPVITSPMIQRLGPAPGEYVASESGA